jgi:hypothetical protein
VVNISNNLDYTHSQLKICTKSQVLKLFLKESKVYTLILVHQINALSDDTIRSNDVQSFWFNYINQTLNLLQDVINKEMTQNNNVSHLCNKHFMELISNARNGEHWANKSKSYLSKCKSGT